MTADSADERFQCLAEDSEVLFLGTGIMGLPMAINLHRAGQCVIAWNRTAEKLAPLVAVGIPTITRITDLPRRRRTAIVMVSTGSVVESVLFGADGRQGAVDVLAPDSLVIVMSSIPMETAISHGNRLAGLGIHYIDAPVSGGESAAKAGTLSIMAGGDASLIALASTVLAPLGRLTRVGPTGAGCLAKLANQLIVGVTIAAVAEALILVELGGGDPSAARTALLGGFADSTILRQHGARMIERRFEPGAHATTQLKDLRTALDFSEARAIELPLLGLCEALFRDFCGSERRSLDHSALYLAYRERARLSNT